MEERTEKRITEHVFNQAVKNKRNKDRIKQMIHRQNLQREREVEEDVTAKWNGWLAQEVGIEWIN